MYVVNGRCVYRFETCSSFFPPTYLLHSDHGFAAYIYWRCPKTWPASGIASASLFRKLYVKDLLPGTARGCSRKGANYS